MKRFLTILAVVCVLMGVGAQSAYSAEEFDTSAYVDVGIYAVDLTTGTVLIDHNADVSYEPLSLTKVLSAMVLLDYMGPAEEVTVGYDMLYLVEADASLAYLVGGETLTVEQLLYGMLLPSGNDAARAGAVAAGRRMAGTEDLAAYGAMLVFVDAMNAKAAEIGMSRSHFTNPDGYPEYDMYTTAKDMTLMSLYATENYPLIAQIAGTSVYTAETDEYSHLWINTNKALLQYAEDTPEGVAANAEGYYDARIRGIKTGSGNWVNNFTFRGQAGGFEMVGTVLGVSDGAAEETFHVSRKILDWYEAGMVPELEAARLAKEEEARRKAEEEAAAAAAAEQAAAEAAAEEEGGWFDLEVGMYFVLLGICALVLLRIILIRKGIAQ